MAGGGGEVDTCSDISWIKDIKLDFISWVYM